jgi:predicted SnoaL-like aldol condensation-catalyzing enzyme
MSATEREAVNPKTGLTLEQMKDFIRNHFEQFVNQKNLDIADVNFATEFIDHGADVPPGTAPGPAGAKQYVGGAYKRFPDIHVQIEDIIAEDDATTNQQIAFRGIVIWRIANRKIVERWAYLEKPHPANA